jgi:hypothetical protein
MWWWKLFICIYIIYIYVYNISTVYTVSYASPTVSLHVYTYMWSWKHGSLSSIYGHFGETITINLGYFSHFRPMRRSEGSPGNGKTWTENLRGLFQSIGLGHSKMGKIMQSLGPLQFSANINWDCDPQNWFTSRIVFLSFVIRSSGAAFFGWSNIPLPELVQGTTRHSWRKSEADFG